MPFCVIQVARTKAPGGIETAVMQYDAMAKAAGLPTRCLYDGPAGLQLQRAGVDVTDAPQALSGIYRYLPFAGSALKRAVRNFAGGRKLVFIVHSDRTLPALRRLFPDAFFAAPCHSDRAEAKRNAHIAITLNPRQHALVSKVLAGSACQAVMLGNPFSGKGMPASEGGITRLVFCARFTDIKNPMALIEAHASLGAPAPLAMYGDGPLLESARAAAGSSVEFHGWTADPWSRISRSDILVTPSKWEGLPYLLLEALDRAVPVIASDISGNREALGDGRYGLLYTEGDQAALASAISQALDDPAALRSKALEGHRTLPGRFGPEAFWRRFEKAIVETPGWD